MSNDSIEIQLKTIANLKRETINSHSLLSIRKDKTFTYYFTSIEITLRANTISELLEKVIKYIIVNRVYIKGSNDERYPYGIKKNIIRKYKLIAKKKNGTKRIKIT